MVHPTPNRLIGHRHSAFRQQIFDVAQAEGEPEVEPYRLVNDLNRETISAVADFVHPFDYAATGRTASPTRRDNADYTYERDRDTVFRFGNDTQVSATNFLALTEWHLGEFERARQLIDESTRRANELGHVAAIASALFFRTAIESRRGDDRAAQITVKSLRALTHEHSLKTYADLGEVYANWVRGKPFWQLASVCSRSKTKQRWLNGRPSRLRPPRTS